MYKRLTAIISLGVLLGALAACNGRDKEKDAAPAADASGAAPKALAQGARGAGVTLKAILARGRLNCRVNGDLVGFAHRDNAGRWRGFDVDFCRATAAAVLGNADAVAFVPVSTTDRIPALASGEVDVLWRNTSWTYSRDAGLAVDFPGVNYYDGQGFMVARSLDVTSATELNGARICVQNGSTTELNLADWFRAKGLNYTPVVVADETAARTTYMAEGCDALTADVSALAAARTTMANPGAHIILPEVISKEPMGPVVRHGDDQWADIVRWTLDALILAEELGITSQNAEAQRTGSANAEVRRLLGVDGQLGPMLGLKPDWAYQAIRRVGNYGEVFERNVGAQSSMKLERGLNALWSAERPGLLYAPPMR